MPRPTMADPHDLPSLLQWFADTIGRSNPDVRNAYALVLEFGRSFTPQPKPKGIKWGRRKRCYKNAYDLMKEHPALTYCEGFVLLEKVSLPIAHAWCSDQAGGVVDNTVRASTIAYFGIPFDRSWATRMIESGTGLLVEHLLSLKKIPKTAIAKPHLELKANSTTTVRNSRPHET